MLKQFNTEIASIRQIVEPLNAEISEIKQNIDLHNNLYQSILKRTERISSTLGELRDQSTRKTEPSNNLEVPPEAQVSSGAEHADAVLARAEPTIVSPDQHEEAPNTRQHSRSRIFWLVLIPAGVLVALAVLITPRIFSAWGMGWPESSRTPIAATTVISQPTNEPATAHTASALPDTPTPFPTPVSQATASVVPTVQADLPALVVKPSTATLSSTITLQASGITSVPRLSADIISTTVMLTPTQVLSESIELLLPENLFAQTTDQFSMPVTIILRGDGFEPATVSVTETVVMVRGVGTKNTPDIYSGSPKGAYLWSTREGRNPTTDTVRPEGKATEYILLQDGDQVRILGGAGDLYYVSIVTNEADRVDAEGKRGWVRKDLVHGE